MSVDNILSRLGIRTSALDSIRLARGVVGNTTYVICLAVLVIGGIAWVFGENNPDLAITLCIVVAGIAAFYLLGTWIFAHLHPDLALLGGAELLQWRQMDMAAKGMGRIPDAENVTPPLIPQAEDE